MADRTITLSIAEGQLLTWRFTHHSYSKDGGRVEAQTPDGTRVATPNSSKDIPTVSIGRSGIAGKSSYAAALKAKPVDWHLEFSMDDYVLPLDLTIYGAIHQHETRKKSGTQPSSSMWQGVYTVKFRKVNGPPGPEGEYLDYYVIGTSI